MLNAGLRLSFGVFFTPLQNTLGVSRGSLSLVQSFFELGFGFFQLIMGRMVDIRGPKQIIALGLAVLGVSFLLLSQTNTIWLLYPIYGLMVAFGAGSTSLVTNITLLKKWFPVKSTLAVSAATASVSSGQLIMIPVISFFIIYQGVTKGYAFLSLLTALTLLLAIIGLPKDDGTEFLETNKQKLRPLIKFNHVVRSRSFWTLGTVFLVCGFGFSFIATHLIPFATDLHLSQGHAANALALIGGVSIIGTLGAGYISRFISRPKLTCLLFVMRAAGMLLLFGPVGNITLYVFAVIFGLTWTSTVPLITELGSERFGVRNTGTVLGALFLLHQVGAAAGSYLGGLTADFTHGYHLMFVISFILDIGAALLILTYRQKTRTNQSQMSVTALR